MTLKTEVVDKASTKRIKLDKFMTSNSVREVHGYEPFPSDSVPKVLVKKNPSKTQTWEYAGDDKDTVLGSLRASRSSTTVPPCWMDKYVAPKQRNDHTVSPWS